MSDSPEQQSEITSEILNKLRKKKMTRREAISTIGKAAIGVGVVAVVGIGSYEYLASQPASGPATSTSTPATSSSSTSTPVSTTSITSKTLKYLKGAQLNLLDIQTLQPSLDYHVTLGGEQLYNELQGKLTEFDDSGNIVPFMADSWSTPDGGSNWVFKLKQGVKWSDGHDFTSDDVKFNFDRLAALKSKVGFYPTLTGATVIDKYTVQVNNTKPINFPSIAATDRAGTLMPKLADSLINPNGDDPWGKNYFSTHVVGTGPFMLTSHTYNLIDTAARNPYYWEKDADGSQLPYLDQVNRVVQTDATTRYTQGQAGQYQAVTQVPTAFWDQVKASTDWALQSIPSNNYAQVYFNFLNTKSSIQDVRVRQAIAYATDRQAIINLANSGIGSPVYMFFSDKNPYYNKQIETIIPTTPDINKAKQLLSDAGFPNGINLEMLSSTAWGESIMKPFAAVTAKAGINWNVEIVDPAAYVARTNQGNWEVSGGGSGDKVDQVVMWAGSQFGNSNILQTDPQAASLVDQLATTVDPAKIKDIVGQLQLIVANKVPQIGLYKGSPAMMYKKNTGGYYWRLSSDNAFAAQPSMKKAGILVS